MKLKLLLTLTITIGQMGKNDLLAMCVCVCVCVCAGGGGRGKISRLLLFNKFCNLFLFFCGHTVTKPIMDERYWTIFSICRKCLLFCKILIYVIRAVIACLQS